MDGLNAAVSKCSAVLKPTRKDLRAVRQILAGQCEGEQCPSLVRLATGDLSLVLRFLSAIPGLSFIFVASHRRQLLAFGGSREESVLRLGFDLLGEESQPPGVESPHFADSLHALQSSVSQMRRPVIADAVELVCDSLRERDDVAFVLGWRFNDEVDAQLDRSFGLSDDLSRDHIRWFLRHRLGVTSLGAQESKLSKDGVLC